MSKILTPHMITELEYVRDVAKATAEGNPIDGIVLNMPDWVCEVTSGPEWGAPEGFCGTAACVAGTLALRTGWKRQSFAFFIDPNDTERKLHASTLGFEVLGVDEDEMNQNKSDIGNDYVDLSDLDAKQRFGLAVDELFCMTGKTWEGFVEASPANTVLVIERFINKWKDVDDNDE